MTVKIFLASCSERVKRGVEKSLGHEIQWRGPRLTRPPPALINRGSFLASNLLLAVSSHCGYYARALSSSAVLPHPMRPMLVANHFTRSLISFPSYVTCAGKRVGSFLEGRGGFLITFDDSALRS